MSLFTKTEEQKTADAEARQRKAEAKAAESAAKEERQRLERERRLAEEFARAPQGMARAAFERGDDVFQYSVDVQNTKAVVVKMVAATTTRSSNDPSEILNAVCREGWDLVNGSFVFLETGSESRDKFLASGQQVAVKGSVIGYYLFKRKSNT
jgi:hypothetical protein